MKFTKYIAAGMIALAGLTSCNDSFLDTEYTNYLDEEAAAEAASKNPDVFLNGMWAWMVTYNQTANGAHDDFGYMGNPSGSYPLFRYSCSRLQKGRWNIP